jgi:hypothetical protein
MPTPVTAHDVAAAIIHQHHPVSAQTLHTLTFHTAGRYAALTGQLLFPEPIEAHTDGPNIPALHTLYPDTGTPLNAPAAGNPTHLNDLAHSCIDIVIAAHTASNLAGGEHDHTEPIWGDIYNATHPNTLITLETLLHIFRQPYNDRHIPDWVIERLFT